MSVFCVWFTCMSAPAGADSAHVALLSVLHCRIGLRVLGCLLWLGWVLMFLIGLF